MAEIIEKPTIHQEMYKNEYMTPLAHMIMNLYVQNLSIQQIADRLEKGRQYVSSVVCAPNFQHMLSIRRAVVAEGIDDKVINAEKEAADVLKAHAKATAERMVQLVDSENDAISFRAGSDLLDRVGPQKRQKGADASATVVVIDKDAAMLIKETAEMI